MIVVINPSGSSGQSFKGLHAYCAHDQERAQTSERVDWIDTRNIAANDPAQSWKIMAATAKAQNDIKRAAGIRAGNAPKDGAVMHVVLSFADGEPMDREAIATAADEFLSRMGVDPAKMHSKNKPSRRQFANEHQAVMYDHSDTKNTHVHLMINRIHPETGIVLPTNNDQVKAQKWAL